MIPLSSPRPSPLLPSSSLRLLIADSRSFPLNGLDNSERLTLDFQVQGSPIPRLLSPPFAGSLTRTHTPPPVRPSMRYGIRLTQNLPRLHLTLARSLARTRLRIRIRSRRVRLTSLAWISGHFALSRNLVTNSQVRNSSDVPEDTTEDSALGGG